MKRSRWQIVAVIFILSLSLMLGACAGGDDDPSDGDEPDGDTPDGDEPDGDEPDGDEPDGDTPDGDEGPCQPGDNGLCFSVLSGDLAGDYNYVAHNALPSGCTLDEDGLAVQFFDSADGWSTFGVSIADYLEPGDYTHAADDLTVQWSLQIGEGDNVEYLNYYNMAPCTVSVIDETSGDFECKLFDNNSADVTFNIVGSWACSD